MPTRREERERMRQERLAAQQAAASSDKRRLYLGYAVAGLIVVAIAAGIVVAIAGSGDSSTQVDGKDIPAEARIQLGSGSVNGFTPDDRVGTVPPALEQGDLAAAAKAANCELNLNLEDEGSTHFGPEAEPPKYGTNPATSGDHIDSGLQQADGAYTEHPDEKYTVHSLEHGRVAIQYSPDLSEQDQLALKGVFDEAPAGVLLFPNPDMPYDVAVTAWTQMVGCDRYEGAATLDVVRDFRSIYLGQGPEGVALVTG